MSDAQWVELVAGAFLLGMMFGIGLWFLSDWVERAISRFNRWWISRDPQFTKPPLQGPPDPPPPCPPRPGSGYSPKASGITPVPPKGPSGVSGSVGEPND